MGDGGFTAEPDKLQSYGQQVQAMAGAIGEGQDAANTTMTENSVDIGQDKGREFVLSKLGLPDTGRLDVAYGIICQPAGMLLEDYEQKITDTIGNVVAMMDKLAAGLGDCATAYRQADQRSDAAVARSGDGLDDVTVPTPGGASDTQDDPRPGDPMPRVSAIPKVTQGTPDAPDDPRPGDPMPRVPAIPNVGSAAPAVPDAPAPGDDLPHMAPIPEVSRGE